MVCPPNQKFGDFYHSTSSASLQMQFDDPLHTQFWDHLIADIKDLKIEKQLVQIPSCNLQAVSDICYDNEDANQCSGDNFEVQHDILLSTVNKSLNSLKAIVLLPRGVQ